MPTTRHCVWCKKAGRDSRSPCYLWVRSFYGTFPVMTEECRVPGCNYADVIAVSIMGIYDINAAKRRWASRRRLVGICIALAMFAIAGVLFVLASS